MLFLENEKGAFMYWQGIFIGLICFLCIGLFHPLVIKGEYYFGVKIGWAFLAAGIVSVGLSLFIENVMFAATMGVIGFSSFWSIHEVFKQRERVKKGWFPAGPSHKIQNEKLKE